MLVIGVTIIRACSKLLSWIPRVVELGERRLLHRDEAEQLYCQLKDRALSVRVRMEQNRSMVRVHSGLLFKLDVSRFARDFVPALRLSTPSRQKAASPA